MRNLPAHQNHQEKSEQHEAQRGQAVLDADDFVVGGKNVGAQEADVFVMAVVVVSMMGINLAERRKLVNGRFHNLFQFVPDHQRQQQRQINDGRKKQLLRARQSQLPLKLDRAK